MAEEENKFYPVVALRGRVALPCVTTSFDAGRLATLAALKCALDKGKTFIAVTQKDDKKEDVGEGDVYSIGTLFSISRVTNLPATACALRARDFTA